MLFPTTGKKSKFDISLSIMLLLVLYFTRLHPCTSESVSASIGTGLRRRRGGNYFAKSLESVSGCVQMGIDFSTILVNTNGVHKCFSYSSPPYTFNFDIPICGSGPPDSSTCTEGVISQINTASGDSYNLGTYTGWSFDYYNNHPAINVTYTNGDLNSCSEPRSSTIFITCDFSAGEVSVSSYSENPTCAYSFIIRTSDVSVCSVLNSGREESILEYCT